MQQPFWHTLPQPFFALAPMEAVTDVVFRQVVARAGRPDIFFTEFANATGWVHAGDKAIAGRLIKTDNESPIVAQIWGGEPGDMEQFAAHCAALGYDGIDINMGCPAKSAIKSGGAALIRRPGVAVAAIAAAKTAGLPVSVKTRLGYTHTDEWREWLRTLLEQDIVNLTIHLRTKKEMSKVPAHYELIDDIVRLRDEVAPQTLLTINGDIRDRAHGLELAAQHPGVNGLMIGRGVFQDPFCFAHAETSEASRAFSPPDISRTASRRASGDARTADCSENVVAIVTDARKSELLDLLNYHLDLFDEWQPTLGRPYETLKRFYKIYVRDFDGAKELRDQLMHTKTTDEVRALIAAFRS
ncbi:MAG: tRNA-dihydrouridine synthase family protein [Candidatus Saccharibacteria bacterium]|nr:tRNA-dihydrouridine synthase family protein [Candidatus Saccharibacteria bacterium]